MAEDDFEFEPDEPQTQTARGLVVNKSMLSKYCGLSPMTIDKLMADGAPIISKGTRKQGWQINTADFFAWYVRRKVDEVTDDPEGGSSMWRSVATKNHKPAFVICRLQSWKASC